LVSVVVVADAGPLIGLARIDRLAILNRLYSTLVVPDAVLAELCVDADRPGSRTLSAALAAGEIEPRALAAGCEPELARLCQSLDVGESCAILLAEQTHCRLLLIDERRGQEVAMRRGLAVVDLAGVLLAAKRSGLVGAVAPLLAALSRQGYRLSDMLVAEVLRLAHE
jgi:predicted nucleic acid-binding protein